MAHLGYFPLDIVEPPYPLSQILTWRNDPDLKENKGDLHPTCCYHLAASLFLYPASDVNKNKANIFLWGLLDNAHLRYNLKKQSCATLDNLGSWKLCRKV